MVSWAVSQRPNRARSVALFGQQGSSFVFQRPPLPCRFDCGVHTDFWAFARRLVCQPVRHLPNVHGSQTLGLPPLAAHPPPGAVEYRHQRRQEALVADRFWPFYSKFEKTGHPRNGCGQTAAALPTRPRAAATAHGQPGPAAHRLWAATTSISSLAAPGTPVCGRPAGHFRPATPAARRVATAAGLGVSARAAAEAVAQEA